MCFGIPMHIKKIDNFVAHCEATGFERAVILFLLQHAQLSVGDFIVSFLGLSTQKLSEVVVSEVWELYAELSHA